MPKRIMPLTDIRIRKAKPGESEYKISDGYGLYIVVTVAGNKLWRYNYRYGGKQKTLALGSYPPLSLADARKKRMAAREALDNGIDPGLTRKISRSAGTLENSFKTVALEWMGKSRKLWVDRYYENIQGRLNLHVFPWLGARPVGEITAMEVLGILRRCEQNGTIDTTHRVRGTCSQILRYAVATGRAERDVTSDLRGALTPNRAKHRAAPTDPREVAPLLCAIESYQGSFVTKCALQLAPMLFVRPGELRAAEWAELDLDAAEWNIPAGRMKMRVAHLVPLSRQAVDIFRGLQPLTGHSRYVFPCHRSPLRPMSENAVNAALRRMGFEKEEITGHGFRAMARTIIDEVLHVRPDYIEQQLAHVVRDPLGRAYNRTEHLPERREMMQLWADYLDTLKTPSKFNHR